MPALLTCADVIPKHIPVGPSGQVAGIDCQPVVMHVQGFMSVGPTCGELLAVPIRAALCLS